MEAEWWILRARHGGKESADNDEGAEQSTSLRGKPKH